MAMDRILLDLASPTNVGQYFQVTGSSTLLVVVSIVIISTSLASILSLEEMLMVNPFRLLKARADAWSYLSNGPRMIDEKYSKVVMFHHEYYNWSGQLTRNHQSNGEPFDIDAPDHRVIFVSSPQHAKELDTASPDNLSLFAATKQVRSHLGP
ncbi:MAG: hypothetical protein Q9198_000332 [Flavoplaca austrocitrina]